MLDVDMAALVELERLMRHAEKPYIRQKAQAIWNLAQGKSAKEVAGYLKLHPQTINNWLRRYEAEGSASFAVKPGRGRPQRADRQEIENVLRQSPRNFGIDETRWTLEALSRVAVSLSGFTPSGVYRALKRFRLSYKRGQPLVHSPDPQYEQKRAT